MYQQFCGIDVSKDSFDITLLESNGEIKLQEKLIPIPKREFTEKE